MNRNDEIIGHLEDYLESFDGDPPLPWRVRQAIHAELPRTRQVRARPRPLEVLTMISRNSAVRWGAAAASVGVAVVLGAAVLNGGNSSLIGGPPASTPAPTVVATASPTATPIAGRPLSSALSASCYPEATRRDCIEPGTYRLTAMPRSAVVSLDVPAGWFVYNPGAGHEGVLVDSGPDAPDGSGWGLMFSEVGSVPLDPCKVDSRRHAPEDVDTAAELATAIAAWPGFSSTEPVGVSVDGVGGVLVEVTSNLTEAACPKAMIWLTTGGSPVDAYPMVGAADVRRGGTFRILEVGDGLLVLRTTEFGDPSPYEVSQGVASDPTRHAADLIELQAMIDSIKLKPLP